MRVLEFFSGIGGMHLSLEGALDSLSTEKKTNLTEGTLSFSAFDTSDLVNQCYRKNFPCETVRQVNIETIKLVDLDGKAEVWTMCPPCQPFTRTQNSKQLDLADKRNKGFLYLMNILERMTDKPEWIFFENVNLLCIYIYIDVLLSTDVEI